MTQRGRRSIASLSVVPFGEPPRPKPPKELTPEQAMEWRAIVGSLPATWFKRESHGLLVQFCRHVIHARHLAYMIREAEAEKPINMQIYSLLLGAEGRQTGAIVSLATKLRLSQSTRLRADAAAVLAAKPSLDSPKPWERGA